MAFTVIILCKGKKGYIQDKALNLKTSKHGPQHSNPLDNSLFSSSSNVAPASQISRSCAVLASFLYHVIRYIQSNRTTCVDFAPLPPPVSFLSKLLPGGFARPYFVLSRQHIRERGKIILAACLKFVQTVVEVTLTLIKLVAMQFVWVVGPCSKTTLSSPRFSFKRIVSEVLVLSGSSCQPKVGSPFFENFYSSPKKKLSLENRVCLIIFTQAKLDSAGDREQKPPTSILHLSV